MAEISADEIATNANAPKKAAGDQGSVETHSIPDQIAADEYRKKSTLETSMQNNGTWPFMRGKRVPTWPS